jgi:hypothetical protein
MNLEKWSNIRWERRINLENEINKEANGKRRV